MIDLSYKEEIYATIGVCKHIHKKLGKGLPEIAYKDAIEKEYMRNHFPCKREKELLVHYKDLILPHKFSADFVVFEGIILEVKCSDKIGLHCILQTLNYLSTSKLEVGLIVNFGKNALEYKKVVY